MLAMSIFPLWWSSFSERLGRRTIYLASFALFVVFNCLCAVSNSIAMLIVMRMLSGGASASVQAVGAGTIADLWESRERGRAMGIFYLGPLCGPLFAPIIGGLLAQRWGWRSTMWFLAAFGALTLIFILFALPETLTVQKPVLPELDDDNEAAISRPLSRVSSKQVAQSTARWLRTLKMVFIDPLKIILYLRFLPVLLSVYYASIAFGSLYVLNVSVEETFGKEPYNFSTIIVGLLYIPNSLGYMVASIFGGKWMDSIMQREARKANRFDEKGRLVFRPEDRMRENAWLGAFLYPAALIWYGWAAEKGVFWLVPVCYKISRHLAQFANYFLIDDSQLFLWHGLDAHLQYGNHHVDRIHAEEVFRRRGPEQLHAKHFLLRRLPRDFSYNRWDRQWMAIHHPRPSQLRK
jgi:multidrug resistance protein